MTAGIGLRLSSTGLKDYILLLFLLLGILRIRSGLPLPTKDNELRLCNPHDSERLCKNGGTCIRTSEWIFENATECLPDFKPTKEGCLYLSKEYKPWSTACTLCQELHHWHSRLITVMTWNLLDLEYRKIIIKEGALWVDAQIFGDFLGNGNGMFQRNCSEPPMCFRMDRKPDSFDIANETCTSYLSYACEMPEMPMMSHACKCSTNFTGMDCSFNTTSDTLEGSNSATSFECREVGSYLIVEYGDNVNFSKDKENGTCQRRNVLPLLRSWCQGRKNCNVSDWASKNHCEQLMTQGLDLRVSCYEEYVLECSTRIGPLYQEAVVTRVNLTDSIRCYYKVPEDLSWEKASDNCTQLGGHVALSLEVINLTAVNIFQQEEVWLQSPEGKCVTCDVSLSIPICNPCDPSIPHRVFCSLPPRVSSKTVISPPRPPTVNETTPPVIPKTGLALSSPTCFHANRTEGSTTRVSDSDQTQDSTTTGQNRETTTMQDETTTNTNLKPNLPFSFAEVTELQDIIDKCRAQQELQAVLPLVLCTLRGLVELVNDEQRLMNMPDALNATLSFLEAVDNYLLEWDNPEQAKGVVSKSMRILSGLLNPDRSLIWEDGPNQAQLLSRFFFLVETLGLKRASCLGHDESITIVEQHVELFLANVLSDDRQEFRINVPGHEGGYMVLPDSPTTPYLVVFQRYTSLSSILSREQFLSGQNEKLSLGPEALGLALKTDSIVRDVIIAFEKKSGMIHDVKDDNNTCFFFNVTQSDVGAFLDPSGCWLYATNESHVLCRCNHLTTFAMLTNWKNVKMNDRVLQLMTWIGGIISIFCLLVCIIVFTLIRSVSGGVRDIIHRHLCICLLVGNILLLAGVRPDDIPMVVCTMVAVMLHFAYLSAFFWMFIEGVQILRMVITVFQTHNRIWTFYLAGYGLPAVIVALTVIIAYSLDEPYVAEEEVCWLNSNNHMMWSFLGPIASIITINTIILVVALRKSQTIKTRSNAGHVERVRNLARGLLVLAPLLGITWIFGFLFFDDRLVVFAYIFTVLNSLQGFFIFTFHFLLNEKVRDLVCTKAQRILSHNGPPRARNLRAFSSATSLMTSSRSNISTSTCDSRRELSSAGSNSSSKRF